MLYQKKLQLKFILLSMLVVVVAWQSLVTANTDKKKPVRIGVAAMISPKNTLNVYQQIIYYVEEKLERDVEMVQRKSYAEMDHLLKTQNVDCAFVCSGPYVADKADFGAELLVAPQAYGQDVYYSYLIVNKKSKINSIEKLRGKTFAFTDPKSNTGCLVPMYMLAKLNETPNTFFGKFIYSGHHDKSIEMVAKGEVDGAAVDHLIWEFMSATDPQYTSLTKIATKSPPYGIPPIVVHPDGDKKLKEQLKKIFLNMHKDKYGKRILSKIFIDQFIEPDDKKYDTVREMQNWLKQNKLK